MAIGFVVFLVSTVVAQRGATECVYDASPPQAIVGAPFILECSLMNCFNSDHYWCLWNGSECTSLGVIKGNKLPVSDKVSVNEVGGRHYECHCLSNMTNCKNYKIAVKPVVNLTLTSGVIRAGTSVNVTCTAESYPPADSVDHYQMEHPKDIDISQTLLVRDNGVVHKILSATKIDDAGLYECTIINLTLSGYENPIQSEKYEVRLQVYEPPTIVTISSISTAILTTLICTINITDMDLMMDVWVEWTRNNAISLPSDHSTAQIENVFYLLLNFNTAADYICNLYSNYSNRNPEDTASISHLEIFSPVDMKNCSDVPTPEALRSSKDEFKTVAIVVIILCGLLAVVTSVLSLLFIYNTIKTHKNTSGQTIGSFSPASMPHTETNTSVPKMQDTSLSNDLSSDSTTQAITQAVKREENKEDESTDSQGVQNNDKMDTSFQADHRYLASESSISSLSEPQQHIAAPSPPLHPSSGPQQPILTTQNKNAKDHVKFDDDVKASCETGRPCRSKSLSIVQHQQQQEMESRFSHSLPRDIKPTFPTVLNQAKENPIVKLRERITSASGSLLRMSNYKKFQKQDDLDDYEIKQTWDEGNTTVQSKEHSSSNTSEESSEAEGEPHVDDESNENALILPK